MNCKLAKDDHRAVVSTRKRSPSSVASTHAAGHLLRRHTLCCCVKTVPCEFIAACRKCIRACCRNHAAPACPIIKYIHTYRTLCHSKLLSHLLLAAAIDAELFVFRILNLGAAWWNEQCLLPLAACVCLDGLHHILQCAHFHLRGR